MATRIPITKDSYNFEDRQKRIWEDMERDMEKRRRDWEEEIDKMRTEFFHRRPESSTLSRLQGSRTLPRLPSHVTSRISEADDRRAIIEKDENGQPVFKVNFDMKIYTPDEINVKVDSTKIMVSARHEEKGEGSTVSREYNREVNIPRDVDPMSLRCVLNPDGYLVIQAPLPVPSYCAIKDSSSALHSPPATLKSGSPYQTSSSLLSGAAKSQPPSTSAYSQPQQQVYTHTIKRQQAAPSSSSTTQSAFTQSAISKDETRDQPDLPPVPSHTPPRDLSKLDKNDQSQSSNQSSSSNTSFSNPSPFSKLSTSSFPSTTIFPDSPAQTQLSMPAVIPHDGKFQLVMPIDNFKPEELTVKTQDRKVVICARREVALGNRAQTMEMSREHSLPDNVDPLTVKAFFTDTNNLIIEAPFIKS